MTSGNGNLIDSPNASLDVGMNEATHRILELGEGSPNEQDNVMSNMPENDTPSSSIPMLIQLLIVLWKII